MTIVGPGGSNTPPALAYSLESGYVDGGVDPDNGDAATTFTFKIVYTDADNNAPAFVRILLDDALAAMSLDPAAADPLRDGDYANGEQYVYSATGLTGGVHDYRFEASDGYVVAFLPSGSLVSGPNVIGAGTGGTPTSASFASAPLLEHEGKTCFIGATDRSGPGNALLLALLTLVLLRMFGAIRRRGLIS